MNRKLRSNTAGFLLCVATFRVFHAIGVNTFKQNCPDCSGQQAVNISCGYSISSVTVTGTDFGAKHMRSLQA